MFNNKKLEYITVRYDCSDELAERICTDFNIEENSGSFVCINCLLTDDYSRFMSFDLYLKPDRRFAISSISSIVSVGKPQIK